MNRLFRLLILGIFNFCAIIGIAQPSILLNNSTAEVGEEVEIVFTVKDFASMLSVELSLNWDKNALQFVEVSAVNPQKIPSLTFDNLNTDLVGDGKLGFSWEIPAGVPEINPDDGTWFFKLIFKALKPGETVVSFAEDPVPVRIVRFIPGVANAIFDFRDLDDDGTITNGVIQINGNGGSMTPPANPFLDTLKLVINTDKEYVCSGDRICFDVNVENFTDILSTQFKMSWDTTLLKFDTEKDVDNDGVQDDIIRNIPTMFPFVDINQVLTVSFFDLNGVSLADGDRYFQLCFEVVGEMTANADLAFEDDFEILNVNEDNLDLQTEDIEIEVIDCTSLVFLNTTCESGSEGEVVCVSVRANNFPEISNFFYSHTWDPTIMDFEEIRSINSELSELERVPGVGSVTIDWSPQGSTTVELPNNSSLYDICFRLKADVVEGQSSKVTINKDESLFTDKDGILIDDIRISDDCAIEVEAAPLPVVKLSVPDTTIINEGSTRCIDIVVENFKKVDFLQFPITWDEKVIAYSGKDNDQLDNINIRLIPDNELLFEWESPNNPITLDDGTAIVSLCFEAVGDATVQETSESALVFSGSENILITRNNIPFPPADAQPGLVLLNAVAPSAVSIGNDFILNLKRKEQVCVPITVQNFEKILNVQTAFQWDSTVLKFDYVFSSTLPGLQDYTRGDLTTGNWNLFTEGQLNLSWLASDDNVGETLRDDAVLAELCFTAVGKLGKCTRLKIAEAPPFSQEIYNISSVELELVNEGKDICITPFGIEADNFVQPDCNGEGSLEVRMTGGSDNYQGTWTFWRNGIPNTLPDPQFAVLPVSILNQEKINSDLDSVCLLVFNGGDFNMFEERCWTVEVSDDRAPVADAGVDKETGCDPANTDVELVGDYVQSNQDTIGGVIRFFWTDIQGRPVDPFNIEDETVTVNTAGKFILKVVVASTGCEDTDTVEVRQSPLPQVSVGDVDNITCKNETVTLVGQGENPDYKYEWQNEQGETLVPSRPFETEVSQGGVYIFKVENTINNCTNEERITVFENNTPPIADAGDPQIKGCDDKFLELSGLRSTNTGGQDFLWTEVGDGPDQIIQPNTLTPTIARVGKYALTVLERSNGCSASDTVEIIASPELPVALAKPEAFIGCGESPLAVLDGSPTREFTNANFLYSWKKGSTVIADGRESSILDQTTVRDTGEYLLIIINTENDNCIADTAKVFVSVDDTKPKSAIPNNITVGCTNDCIELPSNTDNSNSEFSYEWSTEDGFICEGEDAAVAQISTFGTYQLVLTNKGNSCKDTSKVTIFPSAENNVGADAGAPKEITCGQDTVLLNGGGSSKEPSHVHEWRFDGNTISNDLEIMVSQAGTYELIVRDTETGCVDNASVKVTLNQELPKVDAGVDITFSGCSFPTSPPISLVATNSDNGDEFEAAWTTSDGQLTGDTTDIITGISAPGIYTLTIVNKVTGCSASDEVVVASDIFTPVAIIEPVNLFACNNSTLTLDANASDVDPAVQIEWSTIEGNIVSGEDGLTPTIDAPGTYILKLTAENGCEDKAEVVINANENMPVASVVMDNLRIFCNEQMTIDASGSSLGDNIVISWTTTDGRIMSGATTLLPEISAGGTYLLTLKDTISNCTDTKEVIVESDGNLPAAIAGAPQEVCGREATLKAATLPANVTGKWSTLSASAISNETTTETTVDNLIPGDNVFVWTLSTTDCPDYSTDTVSVIVATVPVAVADNFTVTNDQSTVRLDLIQNDQSSSPEFDVNILTSISSGSLQEVAEGIYEYSIPANYLGRQEFEYELCSKACSDICANASVTLSVRPLLSLDSIQGTPNAITPNGDGMNDQLLFDQLFFEDFNDSELVIFNRWGDVVYKESPYNNDWEGRSLDGLALPEGTYYYILRLHIGEGEIIRGEVTILR